MMASIFILVLLVAGAVLLFGILILVRLDHLESRVAAIASRLRPEENPVGNADNARRQHPAPVPVSRPETVGSSVRTDAVPARRDAAVSPTPRTSIPAATARVPETETNATPVAGARSAAASDPQPHDFRAGTHAPQSPSASRQPRTGGRNLEKYIGENLFGKIGIFVLIAGVGFFVKYAIDNGWLGVVTRTALGYAVAALLLGAGYLLRTRYRSFGSLLAGGAFAVVFVTTGIAFHSYGLFSQTAAFAILTVSTLLMTLLAAVGDRRELATVALAGGYIAPFLASRGEGSHLFLFSYVAVLHAGMFLLSLRKRWWEIPVVSFAATWFVVTLFVGSRAWPGNHPEPAVWRDTFLFCTLYYLLFAAAIVAVFRTTGTRAHTWLTGVVTLNNFVYLCYGLLCIRLLGPVHRIDGLLPLTIAAVNALMALHARRQASHPPVLDTLLPGMTVLFVTLAIPIQLQAGTLLVCWAAEAIVLLLLYLRTGQRIYDWSAAALCLLTALTAYRTLGEGSAPLIFRSGETLAVLFAAAALGVAARITHRHRDLFEQAQAMRYRPVNALLIGSALLLCYAEVVLESARCLAGDTAQQAILLFTTTFAALAGRGLRNRFPMREFRMLYLLGAGIVVCCYAALSGSRAATLFTSVAPWLSAVAVALMLADIAVRYYAAYARRTRFTVYLNLLATVVWTVVVCRLLSRMGIRNDPGAGFSVALITAGAVQMVLGMRRRQKVLRLFALGLFALVLAKLLLHDLWQWPTIGRIAVFILLGIILLVLSFLYQRLKTALFGSDGTPEDKDR